jgi:hypothetical protein
LHFEYLVKGRPQDPVDITRQATEQSITPTVRGNFTRLAETMLQQLGAASLMAQASAE